MRRGRGTTAVAVALSALWAFAAPASAQVQPYGTNDYGGFRNILPPGQSHNASFTDILLNQVNGTTPPQWDNQRNLYGDLVYTAPNLQASQIGDFFKDGSFGVLPADAGATYSPRAGVSVVRDTTYGVPHVYGSTRGDVMFGAGYVGAEDRLFFMDALRHSGRAQLSEFAGGANKAMDADVWNNAPYTEADLQRQFDLADDIYGAEGAQLQADVTEYVAGVNEFLSEAQLNPLLLPGEYTLLGEAVPRSLEGDRRDRDGGAGRRHLRQGRRRRAHQRRGLHRRPRALRQGQGDQGLAGLPASQRPRGPDDGPQEALSIPAAQTEADQEEGGGAARPRLARRGQPR